MKAVYAAVTLIRDPDSSAVTEKPNAGLRSPLFQRLNFHSARIYSTPGYVARLSRIEYTPRYSFRVKETSGLLCQLVLSVDPET
jgi:hypothetical protein